MGKIFSVLEAVKEIKNSGFILNCNMPMGYSSGLPLLSIRNGRLCMTVPYLRYRITGVKDKTLVYPIRYVVTAEIPEKKIVEFRDLYFEPMFAKLDFDKPVGLFRHEAIKTYSKEQYFQLRSEMFGLYDKLVGALTGKGSITDEENARLRQLIGVMVEPSLLPVYKALDRDFFNKYMTGGI